MDLNELALFIEVVDQKGFTAAAKRLGLPKSNVSRRLSQLEDSLGVKLLERTSRSVAMTEVGEMVYEQARGHIRELQSTEVMIPQLSSQPKGRLRVEVFAEFGTYFMAGIFADFAMKYPDIQLDVILATEESNMIENKVDVSIRVGFQLEDSSFIARKIASADRHVYGSPHYLNRTSRPKFVSDLEDHDLLVSNKMNSWRFSGPDGPFDLPVKGVFSSNSGIININAALAGRGLLIGTDFMLSKYVEQGRLEKLVLDAQPVKGNAYAVYASRRHTPAKIRVFLDFLIAKAEDEGVLKEYDKDF
jgi:DNA-binding transcriptional LysR family regulator